MQKTAKPSSQNTTKTFTLSDTWNIALLLCLASYIFDAPIRFLLSVIHIESAIYLRDITLAAIIISSTISWIIGKTKSNSLTPIYLISLHLLWGIINLPSIAQPIVGLKILLIYITGIICYETYRTRTEQYHKLFNIAYIISAAGVLYNYFLPMPWTGMTFASAAGDVTINKEWYTAGIQRIAGLARSSTETSAILAILSAPLITSRKTNIYCKLTIYITTLALISITTTKGGVIAWLAIGTLLPFTNHQSTKKPIYFTIWAFACIGLAIPALIYAYDIRLTTNSNLSWLLSSFADRINRMWPEALANIQNHGSLIFGRGLGGIGFAQSFGESNRFNSADSVMLYIYATFGIPGIIYTAHIINKFNSKIQKFEPEIAQTMLVWILYWFVYGVVGNNFETPLLLFIGGLISGAALDQTQREVRQSL